MGVAYVARWGLEENKNIQQTLEDVQKSIERLGASKSGLFAVECDTYQPISGRIGKTLNIISNSEYPLSKFAYFEDNPSLISDNMLPNFLSKLRLFWQQRKGARIECKGNRYVFCDFIFKVGVVSQGANTRGIALEVEYTPCVYPKECFALMTEIMNSITDSQLLASEPQFLLSMKSTDVYTPEMTSLQYLKLFNNFRKIAT